ncbi:MAG TPA: iron-sulfur cluster insertion protein ErpA [Candidatus Nanoarchaeia archaeon]|nr:iron-sulfur cluster insertion protein ErpA [Candidatus Nanoarchaeia archaeon]
MTQSQMQIKKDMAIGEFVNKFPSVVEMLMAEGVHCVGCGASEWETIEQGLMSHGKTTEEVDAVVDKMNNALASHKETKEELIVTKNAAEKLRQILKEEKKEGMGLRIRVFPGGCSGFKYGFEFENKQNGNDKIFEVDGVKFFVDQNSLAMINGSKVDYSSGLHGSGFKISNPKASHTCGCGDSFN